MSAIKGEYWIIEGSAHYADGDVGDTNHEGYALDFLRRRILEAVGIDPFDTYDWDEIVDEIPEAICETLDVDMPEEPDAREMLRKHAGALLVEPYDIDQAFGKAAQDVRDYMAQNYEWICCHRNRFATWFLTREAITTIAEAVGDILDQEGSLDDEDDLELEIFVVSTNKTYSASWRALERGDFSEIPLQETIPAPGPNAQVAAMDRALEHPCYRK